MSEENTSDELVARFKIKAQQRLEDLEMTREEIIEDAKEAIMNEMGHPFLIVYNADRKVRRYLQDIQKYNVIRIDNPERESEINERIEKLEEMIRIQKELYTKTITMSNTEQGLENTFTFWSDYTETGNELETYEFCGDYISLIENYIFALEDMTTNARIKFAEFAKKKVEELQRSDQI